MRFLILLSFATCFLGLLVITAEALNCDIQLGVDALPQDGPAQCDEGCETCNFNLSQGSDYRDGTIECLAEVRCEVNVHTESSSAMRNVELHGELASSVSVLTSGNARKNWIDAWLYGPNAGGDFRFESSAMIGLQRTTFDVTNSGKVEIILSYNGYNPVLRSMDVFAATAESLKIVLQTKTTYDYMMFDSHIECPVVGQHSDGRSTCVWKSNATMDYASDYVHITAPNGIEMICDNPEACNNIRVQCGDDNECQMQYLDSDWQCEGATSATCPLIFTTSETQTTTKAPTTTLEETTTISSISTRLNLITTESSTTQVASGGNDSGLLLKGIVLYAVATLVCVVICCCAMSNVYLWRKKGGTKQAHESDTDNTLPATHHSDTTSLVPTKSKELPPLVVRREDYSESDSSTDLRLRFEMEGKPHPSTDLRTTVQRKGVQLTALPESQRTETAGARRKPPPPPKEGRSSKWHSEEDEDEDDLLYIPMGTSTVGQTQG